MKKVFVILIIAVILTSTECSNKESPGGFFAWMDGYLAMESEEEVSFALTYFYSNRNVPFSPDEVHALQFDGIEDKIEISDYSVTPRENEASLPYDSYAFEITVKPLKTGVFTTDQLTVNIDNTSVTFKIGTWCFEVLDSASVSRELLNVWESPCVGSNPRTLAYHYKPLDEHVKIKEIWLSDELCVSDSNGLPTSGKIEFPEEMEAPIHFLRPKIVLEVDGQEVFSIGISYYSGATNIGENVLEKSFERSKSPI